MMGLYHWAIFHLSLGTKKIKSPKLKSDRNFEYPHVFIPSSARTWEARPHHLVSLTVISLLDQSSKVSKQKFSLTNTPLSSLFFQCCTLFSYARNLSFTQGWKTSEQEIVCHWKILQSFQIWSSTCVFILFL